MTFRLKTYEIITEQGVVLELQPVVAPSIPANQLTPVSIVGSAAVFRRLTRLEVVAATDVFVGSRRHQVVGTPVGHADQIVPVAAMRPAAVLRGLAVSKHVTAPHVHVSHKPRPAHARVLAAKVQAHHVVVTAV